MECPGPRCAAQFLEWVSQNAPAKTAASQPGWRQESLFAAPYNEDDFLIRSAAELAAAFEHLEFALFKRFHNALTRAERARLDNSIDNTLYKIERHLGRAAETAPSDQARFETIRSQLSASRERAERQRLLARRADEKLAQLANLSPESFEEFVGELFEALGYAVQPLGGTGDEGADLALSRGPLLAIVQCKYHKQGIVGSPDLQRFLGSIQHHRSHKGFFVTTRTFSLSAERFARDHPIELIDGPRLVELVREALGQQSKHQTPSWF